MQLAPQLFLTVLQGRSLFGAFSGLLCCLMYSAVAETGRCDLATGTRGAVATVHPLATEAAIDVFESGGNAVDAAVAAAFMLGVVDNHNSGLGGGCFVVIRTAGGDVVAIDGRETAPARAHRDMFVDGGVPQPEWSTTGPLAVATPGTLAAYAAAIESHGTKELGELIRPAAKVADEGFAIDRSYAQSLRATREHILKFPSTRAVLLKPSGQPYEEGERLVQRDLAKTYRAIAEGGADWFYRGPLAEHVGRWMAENGGVLTGGDFAKYEAKRREPIVTTYRGRTIVGMPPPSSGGVHVAQILNILEHFDLQELYAQDPAAFTHVVAEAMKLAFADRAHWLGDADFVSVPRGIVSKEYAAELARKIDLQKATKVRAHGMPPRHEDAFFGTAGGDSADKHTTHIAAADAAGNWVAITATVNTTFGSKVIVPGTGLVLNNEMDDFSIAPGVPNAFGLVGAEANAVAPGKRPLSSMSPTIVLDDGRPIMTVGAAGGPKIITQVVLAIIRTIDLEVPPDESIAAPRFHHQWRPDVLFFERATPADLAWAVAGRGHAIAQQESAGVSQAIWQDTDGTFIAVADPRVPGKAAGF
jgi:gamma-glutamyltranspeptidase/glutathione hydrolase